jgi:hypothetical protein
MFHDLLMQTKNSLVLFIVALFVIEKIWEQHKCLISGVK